MRTVPDCPQPIHRTIFLRHLDHTLRRSLSPSPRRTSPKALYFLQAFRRCRPRPEQVSIVAYHKFALSLREYCKLRIGKTLPTVYIILTEIYSHSANVVEKSVLAADYRIIYMRHSYTSLYYSTPILNTTGISFSTVTVLTSSPCSSRFHCGALSYPRTSTERIIP